MNNILNAQEAFAALCLGKTVLCRHILGEFDSLDQFPATIWVMPEHEFCIKIETIVLAGITFTKPLALEDVKPNQDLFVIQPNGVIHHYKFDNSDMLADCIINGFAQRDAENAELHLKAFCKFFSHDYFSIEHTNIQIIDKTNDSNHWKIADNNEVLDANDDISLDDILGPASSQVLETLKVEEVKTPTATIDYKPKRTRGSKKESVYPQIEHNKDLVIDAIATCVTAEEVKTTCFGLENNGFNQDQSDAIDKAKNEKLDQLSQEKTAAENAAHELLIQSQVETHYAELSVLCDAFITEIDAAVSDQDLKAIRTRINSNGDLTEVESAELATRLNLKSASFEKEQSTVSFESVAAAAVAHAQKLDEETQQKNSSGKSNNDEYQDKLATLKQRVDESKTPTEVNVVVKYTSGWSEDQRAPLLQYMHKRLEELQQNKAEVAPSLMVRIQNAPDLTELDALEIDVSSLDPVIQPEMMRYIRTRRLELEKASTAAINDEDLP
jgi:hypothetical protein